MRVQMLGLCRFSYLGLRGYQKDHATIEERRAYLYDPARLARRWHWFTELALPGWRAQSDPDFTLVILTGPDLPQPYLSRLHDLAAQIPQVRLELVPPMERHLAACRAAIAPHVDATADVIGHFRHDDDDAVALDYIEQARKDFARVRGLWKADKLLSLDYSRGVMLRPDGDRMAFTPRICQNMGVALTLFMAPDADATALHYDHSKLPRWMPGVAVTRPLMFLRSVHGDSDSGDVGPGLPWDLADDALTRQLQRRFGLTRAGLDQLAASLGQGGAAPGAC